MRNVLVAVVAVALLFLSSGIAAASESTQIGHGGDGHGMDMGGGEGHKNAATKKDARTIEVTAGRFRFVPKKISVGAGEDVTIMMTSTDLYHDFFVKGEGHVVGAQRKKTRKGGLRIDQPGTYKFWCSVSGHRAAGMQGTIVVG